MPVGKLTFNKFQFDSIYSISELLIMSQRVLSIIIGLFIAHGRCYMVRDSLQVQPLNPTEDGEFWQESDHTEFSDRQRLILTPFVESGEILEGQKAAKVDGILENLESYSGYFTVNKTHNRNLFFWYFPAEEEPADSPVFLWLTGGPGVSSMLALAQENGPIHLSPDGSVNLRPYRWTKNYHVIYVDSPAGVGFSFPQPTGPVNEKEISTDLYSALEQFFQLFPHIANNDFYVTGESYGGQYVPSTGYAIHKNNPTGRVNINLKGLMIGNGMIRQNCFAMSNIIYIDYMTQIGLPLAFIHSPHANPYNYLDSSGGNGLTFPGIESFFNSDNVQERIHVGVVNYSFLNDNVERSVTYGDRNFNVFPIVEELLEHYTILYYYGQVDVACPYPPSEAELYELRWSGYSQFSQAKRQKWMVGDDLAGYVKSGGNLSLALVRNAGHMVPTDQPAWALDLLTKFLNNELPK